MRLIGLIALLAACEPAKSLLDGDVGHTGTAAAAGGPVDCDAVGTRIREAYSEEQRAKFAADPKRGKLFETTQRVLRESCEQDAWPDSVVQCLMQVHPGESKSLGACNQAMPATLQKKIQTRIMLAMKALEPKPVAPAAPAMAPAPAAPAPTPP